MVRPVGVYIFFLALPLGFPEVFLFRQRPGQLDGFPRGARPQGQATVSEKTGILFLAGGINQQVHQGDSQGGSLCAGQAARLGD